MNPKYEETMRRLAASKERVIDVETSGLSWQQNHIVGYVLSFGPAPQDSYYLPFRHANGGNIEGVVVPDTKDGWDGSTHPMEDEIVRLIDTEGTTNTGHNIAFDLRFLYRVGLNDWKARYQDTMVNAVLIDEWSPSFSLDALSRAARVFNKQTSIYQYIMEQFHDARGAPKQAMGHFWRLSGDDPQVVDYAESDGISTWQLLDWQMARIREQELDRVFDIESRLIPVLARMMTRGVKIDEERLAEVKTIVEGLRDKAIAALPPGFNSKAPTQVRELMSKSGHTDWPTTPTGQPSFPEAWLVNNPIGRQIVAVRKYTNLLTSFIEPMQTTHLWKGRVHPEYNQLRGDEYGTITGRLSSSNPNLQQVHKRNEELGRLYRSIFVPDEGKTWASVDYSQCEPRLLAYYSRSPVLLNGYRADPPLDAHTSVAKSAGIDRETGKRVNQTIITGGGKKVLTSRYGIPPDVVEEVWKKFFDAMPEVGHLQKSAANVLRNRGYVRSLLGRRSRLKDSSKAYVAVNRLLQCGNADILKQKLVEMDDYLRSEGRPVDVLNNVHDAFDMQFMPGDRRHYTRLLQIMTSFGEEDMITLDVPITVDAKEGKNWAQATYKDE